MKKDVDLVIRSEQYAETLEPKGKGYERQLELEDSFEIITEGELYYKNNALYISYDEPEEGYDNRESNFNKTIFRYADDALKIYRYGEEDENMELELSPGMTSITRFKIAPTMSYELEVNTNSLDCDIDEEGQGEINVDYRIKFDRAYNMRNKINVQVKKVN